MAKSFNYQIVETIVRVSDAMTADEMWLSNAIHGIRWVEKFNDQIYKNKSAKVFVKLLNERIMKN